MIPFATRSLCAAVVLAAAPAVGHAGWWGDDYCTVKADREAVLDLAGARSVRIDAKAGSLTVEGRTGLARVEARGTACASSQSILDQVRLSTTRQGDAIVVKVDIPDGSLWSSGDQGSLDLTVLVPRMLPVEVNDGSGSASITHVGSLKVQDGSGELTVTDVAGDATIDDGSGSIEVEGVTGNVRLTDGSGSITVRDVGGSVTVENDGSGGIEVASVKGDFTVEHDGSGGIDHHDIGGQVRVPGDHRRH